MRTTININEILLDKLEDAAEILGISRNTLIQMLLMKVLHRSGLEPKLYQRVKYQDRDPGIVREKVHVTLEAVFYEKGLDMRRNFKFSVAWLLAHGINNYLDEIVEEVTNPDKDKNWLDNYTRNFVYIFKKHGRTHQFISILGFPGKKRLKKLL